MKASQGMENDRMAVEKDDIQYFGCKYALPVDQPCQR